MRRIRLLAPAPFLAFLLSGCFSAESPPRMAPEAASHTVRRPNNSGPSERPPGGGEGRESGIPDISWDTERDRKFAEFLRDKSGGMIRKAAVGIERKRNVQVELDRSVAPDDTLDLTKSVLAGARKDFPDQPITLNIFDPQGEPILTADYRPGRGVNYRIAHAQHSAAPRSETPSEPLTRPGVTESDQDFAAWAEEHGGRYLRYVQADLERNGRLWFGVTREVKPADVPELAKSLLEGASQKFSGKTLTATVFDPDGERIGKAVRDSRGSVHWEP